MKTSFFHPRFSIVALALTAIVCCPAVTQAAGVLSFNIMNGGDYIANGLKPQSEGMEPADTAGAPGVNVGNWNNIFGQFRADDLLVPAPPAGLDNNETSGPYAGNFVTAYGQPVDDDGVAQTGMDLSWYARGGLGQGFLGFSGWSTSNSDHRMMSSNWDAWGRSNDTTGSPDLITDAGPAGVPHSEFDVTGIPYSTYDVYAYILAETGIHGGDWTANGVTKAIEYIGQRAPDPLYVLVDHDGPWTSEAQATGELKGTYLVFEGLSGDLTLSTTAHARLRISGFQIVDTGAPIPEPTTFVLAALGLFGFIGTSWRRRRRA